MVTQRRKEIGIRMALGAGRGSIHWLILRDVSVMLLAGIGAGLGISMWATQLFQKMLFGMKVYDTQTILMAGSVLVGVALFAGYLPARRASRVDPMSTLRNE
jgi:putative ABC transport system permease protein